MFWNRAIASPSSLGEVDQYCMASRPHNAADLLASADCGLRHRPGRSTLNSTVFGYSVQFERIIRAKAGARDDHQEPVACRRCRRRTGRTGPGRQVGEVGVSFGKGIFRFVTGSLKNKAGYDLKTPTATMVVRGTKVIVAVGTDGRSEFTFVEGTGEIIPCGGTSRDAQTGQTLITTPKCAGVSVGPRTAFAP